MGGILIGAGVHFIPVGGAPAAMSQATGVGTGTTMLAAASGLTGLIGAGSAYALHPGDFAFTIVLGGVSAALMISVLAFIANVMYVYGAGVPLASAKVKYDPITRWRQDLYVSRGTEGHGSPMVSFISGIIGAFLAGMGGALVYFGLVETYKAIPGFSATFGTYPAPYYVSLAAAFAIGIFFLNCVMASYNIGGTIEGFHDPKFKRIPRSIVASLFVSLVGGLFALLIAVMLPGGI
ncbi:MAG TPA: tetrahydromethanopterin S-methyltransferase subunit D [Candidatus Bathyarchaeia archaeon]|nr:tetrahydromethanopterin S-methyltransferase subunit D [Candidatus Bathyarchaeia archaeon]